MLKNCRQTVFVGTESSKRAGTQSDLTTTPVQPMNM